MKRDTTLDIVKGVACLLMILAHPKTLHLTFDTELTTFFWYVGFFAPVVFFASVGVSLQYQLNKRTKLQIVIHGTLFSLIPWVGFIFLGDYLQKEKKMRLPVFILASAAALYLKLTGAALTSQSPTPIFITLGIAIYSFVVLISPYLSKIPNVSGFLVFLGKNTLLFWGCISFC